jgi:RNA polymerase sigma-70 factor (ECF subfamily)
MHPRHARLEEVEALYRLRLLDFRRVAAAVSGDREAAADIVQEAFVRAVRELGRFAGRGSLEAWVWKIVVNASRNHRRDAQPTRSLADDQPSTNGHAPTKEAAIAAAVAALPERQRLVLFLRYYADLDYGAIAQALDISAGTVGATLHAARSALEQLLSKAEATR